MDASDFLDLWTAWPVAGPWHISPLVGGTNSLVWRAGATDGQSYVLRISNDLSRIPRIRYESALLQALSEKDLPFLLPLPVKAKSGDIIVLFEQKPGISALATLCPLLPGKMQDRPPERNDLLIASHAASALALLDHAFASLAEAQLSDEFASHATFGELSHCHPLVPDPLAAVAQLPLEREQAKQICIFLNEVIESVPQLYAQLPQQLVHRDYDPGNILLDQQRVIAILDFEFAGRDIRVLDLCVALSWWPINLMGTGKEWDLIDTFGTTYTHQHPLQEEELLALPTVFRLRDAFSFVHRMGRYLAGMETEERMQSRVQHSLWREAWLSAHQETLICHALKWNRGTL